MSQNTAYLHKGNRAEVGMFGANGNAAVGKATAAAAVATTGATQTSPFGFTTAAQANNIITLLNQIRGALVAAGLMV